MLMAKAVILAAGIGSRLGEITEKRPKCLTKVGSNGKSIIEYQIEGYIQAGIKERDINIVIGYKAEQVIEFVSKKYSDIQIFINQQYRETNNMFSLYIFLSQLKFENCGLLISNGDCIYSKDIIKGFYDTSLTSNKNLIACDDTFYDIESMKIQTSGDKIIKISKDIPQEYSYALSIDLYYLTPNTIKLLLKTIEQYIENNNLNLWTEVALQDLFSQATFIPHKIPYNSRWIEIDTQEDLLRGHKLFSDLELKKKKVCICDLDGTVYIGNKPIPTAIEFINKNKDELTFYFLTNNTSKTPSHYQKKLETIGISVESWQILTPLDPLIDFLNSCSYKNIALIANKEVESYIKRYTNKNINDPHIPHDGIVLTYDTELDYPKIQLASTVLNKTRLLIATHLDKMCPSENGPIPDIGSFISMLSSTLGGFEVQSFGKPNINIIQKLLNRHSPHECFIVGDRLYTDYALARQANIDFLCVLTGETRLEDIQNLTSLSAMSITPSLSLEFFI